MIGLLLFATLAAAEPPRAFAMLLELSDPEGRLVDMPSVQVVAADGQVRDMLPRDDGEAPDEKPGDRVYTHPLPNLGVGTVAVTVRAGATSWAGQTEIPESAGGTLLVRLQADGTAEVVVQQDTAVAGAFDIGTPARTVEEFRGGFLLWAVLLAGFGFGAGMVLAEGKRKARVPATLAALSPGAAVAPLRLGPDAVDAALAGPLAAHRVVCAGALANAPAHVVPCVEPGVLPVELVAAVEALAAGPGAPVALLVTDLAALDAPGGRMPPAEALAVAVAGRFPLYVVGGPAGWEAWSPSVAAVRSEDGDASSA
ncbi:MAG: hypothetical protein Q8P41_10040 [Pseudomonadota bacterium]|nr:hypothetical protein [Pseudomonadota bacterium]